MMSKRAGSGHSYVLSARNTRYLRATIAALIFLAPSAMVAQNRPMGVSILGTLSITNYQVISTVPSRLGTSTVTYSAELLNSGPALTSVTATVASSQTGVSIVSEENTLTFAPVPANSVAPTTGTFELLVSPSVTVNLADLQWTFQSVAAPVTANAGPNQTVNVSALVTLNGSASTNQSGIGTLSYDWVFTSRPPGSKATLSNSAAVMPTFVADLFGSYVITLTVSNGRATSSASVTITTGNTAPVANAGPNQTVAVGSTVVLNGSGSSDVDGNPLTYDWTLLSKPALSNAALTGANTVSPTFVADFPAVPMAPPGTEGNRAYVVQLIVTDGTLSSTPSTVTITTTYTPPVANAGPNQSLPPGSVVQLDGSGSTDVDGIPLTYNWSILSEPTGSSATLNVPTAVNPMFTADLAGLYVLQLIVNDGIGNSLPSTVTISTEPIIAPTAIAGPNQAVAQHAVVQLQGSGTDPQGLPLTYLWALIGKPTGSAAVLSSTTAVNPTFTADLAGMYVAQLIVNDGFLSSAPSTLTISTNVNTPPVANPGPNQIVAVGATVTLNGSMSSDADNDPLTYSWSLLSVPSGSAAKLKGATTATPTFVADVAGIYVAQLIVSDGSTPSAPATLTVTAQAFLLPVNPTVTVGGTTSFPVTLAQPAPAGGVFISLSSSNTATVTVSQALIYFSAGSTVPRPIPSITGVAAGSATITASSFGLPSATVQVQVTH
jgi:K319-like protein